MLIYIHGFNSSPASSKAVESVAHFRNAQAACLVPALSENPAAALQALKGLCESCGRRSYLAGSSLGGFYATWLVENGYAPGAVLINPAVAVGAKLVREIGKEQRNWHTGEAYLFTQAYADALVAMDTGSVADPQRYLLLVQKGDEVLDWSEAAGFYAGCEQIVEEGGDHGFDGFERHLPSILERALAAAQA